MGRCVEKHNATFSFLMMEISSSSFSSPQEARLPKITVATVTYNAANEVERTIRSVEQQVYAHVEHLIVDGNSSDDTLHLVHEYQKRNSRADLPHEVVCLSEPDEGLYDAMNKALGMATGDYIVFLNAGDSFPDADTLTAVAEQAKGSPAIIYGQTTLVDRAGNEIGERHLQAPEKLTWGSFRKGMLVCHQSFYVRMDLGRQTLYDRSYRFSADYDWCVRLLATAQRLRLTTANTHRVLCLYLSEGLTTRNHKRSLWERFQIMCRHYGVVSTVLHHLYFFYRNSLRK